MVIILFKKQEKKLALTLFYFLGKELWLGSSWKLICIDQSGFYNFLDAGEFRNV